MNVNKASENVIAIFPVTLIPIGVKPNRFRNNTKKKIVKRKLIYFL